tara:strand:+ start:527 stop:685 length:159 start_codon:yes stop_codon:yes gene_type:complete
MGRYEMSFREKGETERGTSQIRAQNLMISLSIAISKPKDEHMIEAKECKAVW